MKQFSKDLGNVSLAPKGRWSKEQEYERLNLVYNDCDNLSYVAKIDVPIGVEIDNREYWQPMNATGYADNNFINLTTESETGTVTAYESLEEAVATILPINRRAGATLSFYNLNADRLDRQAEFELWQFNSTDLANWENRDYWNNIYYNWNVFAGWYVGADGLKNHVKIPNVGQYAYVGTNLNDALLYQCRTNGTWTNTGIKVRNYISVVVSGNITIGENGNWFSDGKDTGIPATPAVDEQLDNIIMQLQQHATEINNLKASDANLQDQITSNDSDITNLTAKHESLSRTVQGIAATGGASTAINVTYNNDNSGLNAENVQDAIDEVQSSKFDKTSILQESGEAEDKVMSQKAVSDKLSYLVEEAKIKEKTIINQSIISKETYNTSITFEVKKDKTYRIYCKADSNLNQKDLSIYFRTSSSDTPISNTGHFYNNDLTKKKYIDITATASATDAVLRFSYSGGNDGVKLSIEIVEITNTIKNLADTLEKSLILQGNVSDLKYTSLQECNELGYYFISSTYFKNIIELSEIDISKTGSFDCVFINYKLQGTSIKISLLLGQYGQIFTYYNNKLANIFLQDYKNEENGLSMIHSFYGMSQKAIVDFVTKSLFYNLNEVFTYKVKGNGNIAIYIPISIEIGDTLYYSVNRCSSEKVGIAYRIGESNTWIDSLSVGNRGHYTAVKNADGMYFRMEGTGENSMEIGFYLAKSNSIVGLLNNGKSSNFVTCTDNALQVGVGTPASDLPFACISVGINNLTGSSGKKNITIGSDNLNNTTGEENVSIGYHSMFRNTSGKHNTCIGSEAGDDNTIGNFNCVLGSHAMQRNNKGHGNVVIGYKALLGGETNYEAGGGNRETGYNVAIGYNSALNLTGGYSNISIGADAMKNQEASIHNIAIGNGAMNTENQYNNCIVIGQNANPTKSNQIIVGTELHKEVVFCGNKKIIFNTDGSVTWEQI